MKKEKILKIELEGIKDFCEGFARFRVDGKCGLVDENGVFVVEPKYDRILFFADGFAGVKLDGKYGFVSLATGEELTPIQWDWAEPYSEGLFAVKQGESWGYINEKGEVVIPIKYDWAESFDEGFAVVELDGDVFVLDRTGDLVKVA